MAKTADRIVRPPDHHDTPEWENLTELPAIANRRMGYVAPMRRFIVLSFLLLAWVFYELSGGADFVPHRPAPADTPQARPQTAQTTQIATRAEATPPATVAAKVAPAPTQPSPQSPLRTGLSGPLGGLELTSLTQGAAGLRQAPPPAEPAQVTPDIQETTADIREITGLRVNMRDGPGTIYPVIARLQLGEKVEVLGDSGTGWLRLRGPDRRLGWVAASLVSRKAP